MTAIELLAPAKNASVGMAAIDAGADAVYIGGPAFGARKAAGNSLSDIATLVQYAHFFGAKVLVTLNTLLRDDELPEAVRLSYSYRQIGVDALIVQDLRLASVLFGTGHFSGADGGIRLHASTQCDNRDVQRVQELEQMGFRRVVLARELSYDQIRDIRVQTRCELEAFVHGALCVSYSGACYLSEAMCGRSANRGECAQMCRLPYDVLDERQNELLHQKHILSLRDLDRSASLRELLETGVTTLKIEGRLKDADYVRNVVAYYHQLLQSMGVKRSSQGLCRTQFSPQPEKTFHRGRTDYFSYQRPAQLVNQETPKSTGEFLGLAPIDTQCLHNGDGLTFAGQGCYWPARLQLPAGTPVYRNYDADFHRQLTAKDACTRVLPVQIIFTETAEGGTLSIAYGDGVGVGSDSDSDSVGVGDGDGDSDSVSLSFVFDKQRAQNAERADSTVRQQLSKLGGTRLEASRVEVRWLEPDQPLFLPASQLNEMRRQLVEAFTALRTANRCAALPDRQAEKYAEQAVSSNAQGALPPSAQGALPRQLMTCRYCILHEMGRCRKCAVHESDAPVGMPTYLRLTNARTGKSELLRIVTHCAASPCYMTLEPNVMP